MCRKRLVQPLYMLKAGFHMIADRNKVCDRLRSYGNYFCDRLRSCNRDRRRSQKIAEVVSI